jgi:hypothetical protein
MRGGIETAAAVRGTDGGLASRDDRCQEEGSWNDARC